MRSPRLCTILNYFGERRDVTATHKTTSTMNSRNEESQKMMAVLSPRVQHRYLLEKIQRPSVRLAVRVYWKLGTLTCRSN